MPATNSAQPVGTAARLAGQPRRQRDASSRAGSHLAGETPPDVHASCALPAPIPSAACGPVEHAFALEADQLTMAATMSAGAGPAETLLRLRQGWSPPSSDLRLRDKQV